MIRNALLVVAVVSCLVLAGCTGSPAGTPTDAPPATATNEGTTSGPADTSSPADAGGETTRPQVELRDANGTLLARVTVAIADTGSERFTGLSDTERLNESEGMLFVYESPQRDAAYVMRDMDFPLDIVFVAPNGTITTIHHAATEPGVSEENLTRYPGDGQYVLEVNRGYTNRTGVTVGGTVAIPASIATSEATPTPEPGGVDD